MSQAIQDAVNICQIVHNNVSKKVFGTTNIDIKKERLKAIREVAYNRNATRKAIRHSITTALDPNIWSITEFDDLLYDWIVNDGKKIKSDLIQKSKDIHDLQAISKLP